MQQFIFNIFFAVFCCCRNSFTANVAIRKVAVSLADSVDLRIILSVLYIVTEVMRAELGRTTDLRYMCVAETFRNEISESAHTTARERERESEANIECILLFCFRSTDWRRIVDGQIVGSGYAILQWDGATFSDEKSAAAVVEGVAGRFGRHGHIETVKG